eukprot:TRINITY_DN9210_c0_g1_i3.p1 TRINITY_DN9210_c0_g1~~TRINITY_DN9210_c0_g1_i3.p1  ORF type:complete len:100 (+),score=27.89 TRINITY_DN9210_c0_g1_i3:128-427(+)
MAGLGYLMRGVQYLVILDPAQPEQTSAALKSNSMYNVLPALLLLRHPDIFHGKLLWGGLFMCVAEGSVCYLASRLPAGDTERPVDGKVPAEELATKQTA